MLAEQHDEWTEMRRHIGPDVLARSRITLTPASTSTEVNPAGNLQALGAYATTKGSRANRETPRPGT